MDARIAGAIIAMAVIATWATGSLAAISSGEEYAALDQPDWAPPGWLFGPVWTVLYILIAVAGFLAWRATGTFRHPAMGLYGGQLLVNALWTPLFFAWDLRGLALAWIILLDLLVIATIVLFARAQKWAAGLLAPYLAWILFATALNGSVWVLNR